MAQRVGLNLQHLPRYKSSPKRGLSRCLLSLQRCCCSLLDDGGQYFKKIAAKLFIGFFSPRASACVRVCVRACVRVWARVFQRCASGRAASACEWCVCVCECNCYTLSPRSSFYPSSAIPPVLLLPPLPLLRRCCRCSRGSGRAPAA